MTKKLFSAQLFTALFLIFLTACGEKKKPIPIQQNEMVSELKHASGFTIEQQGDFKILSVNSAWPGAEVEFKYALVPREKLPSITLPANVYDAIVPIPVDKMIITSTTHIASLEALDVLDAVIGFPSTNLVSSPVARTLIDDGHIKELGTNENINTEIALELSPEVVIGFGISDTNKAYETLKRSGVPIVYNGDWTESTPLGKAEWIKFFAPFFQKEIAADSIFNTIETSYMEAKLLAKEATQRPSVLTGGLYKDVWYISGGKSWMAQFLEDANANYLWSETENTGSIGLSLEAVLEKAQPADFWFNPSLHSSYEELLQANAHYEQFTAFANKKVFSNAVRKGPTGGLLFYELAPQRPDLVLKDLISILHPGLLSDYEPYFFRPLH